MTKSFHKLGLGIFTALSVKIFCICFFPAFAMEDLANGWTANTKLSIRSTVVNGDLTDFPVYVDLSNLPDSFFSTVKSDGSDIRITNGNTMTQVPVEVVSIDTTANAGELWFKADFLSGSSDKDFYIYYGNGNANFPAASATFGSQSVWANGYSAVYHMNESPELDGARKFTRSNTEYFSLADNTDLSTGDIDFTIAAWVYLDTLPGGGNLFGFVSKDQPTGNQREYSLRYYDSTDRFELLVTPNGSTTAVVRADNHGAAVAGQWYFLIAWHDATANTLNIQVDNNTADSLAHTTGVFDSTAEFDIGARLDGGTDTQDGRISKVGFWKRTLTAAEKTYLFNQGSGRQYKELGLASTNGSALKTSLISYWNLNEASGNALDSHGSNNLTDNSTVTAGNGPSINRVRDGAGSNYGSLVGYNTTEELEAWKSDTPLANGYSLELDGSNDYIAIPDDSVFDITDDITITAWINRGTDSAGGIFGKGNGTWDYSFYYHVNVLKFYSSGTAPSVAVDTITLPAGAWTNVAIVRENGTTSFYVNGDLSTSHAQTGSFGTTGPDIRIGEDPLDSNLKIDGLIDDVRIYNDALSANEIRYLYNGSGTNPTTTNLVALWDFDDGPNKVLDSSPNKNHALPKGVMNNGDLVSGTISKSIEFDGTDDYLQVDNASTLDLTTKSYFSSWVKHPVVTDIGDKIFHYRREGTSSGLASYQFRFADKVSGGIGRELYFQTNNTGGTWKSATSTTSVVIDTNWHFHTANVNNGVINMYFDSTALTVNGTVESSFADGDRGYIGARVESSEFLTGQIDELHISNVVRSADWSVTEYNNQSSPKSFYLINDITFFESKWTQKNKITIQASQVNGDLTNFPVYIDLSDMPSGFFSQVKSDGGDIRITKGDKATELAYELVRLDTGNGMGELWFKADMIDNGSDTEFYIFYGNSSASAHAASDTYGSQAVWSNSFVGVWHMQEDPAGGASSILDSTSSANHGSPSGAMNSADLVNGQLSKAIDFDGVNDIIDIGNVSEMNFTTGSFSIAAWAKATPAQGRAGIIEKRSGAGAGWRLRYSTNNNGNASLYDGSSGLEPSSSDIQDSNWHQLVGTYQVNAGNWEVELFLDGSSVSSATGASGNSVSNANPVRVGVDNGAHYLSGSVDELQVSSVVRSANWVSAAYNNQSSPSAFYKVSGEGGLFDWLLF